MQSSLPDPRFRAERHRWGRRESNFLAVVASLLMAAVLGAGTTRATEIFIYSTTAGTTLTYQGGGVMGVTYTTLGSAVTFNSLGFIDLPLITPTNYNNYYGNDGLVGSYELGIWLNSAPGTLLASTTVTPSSTLNGEFRYAPIPATTIPANTAFTIAALLPDGPLPDAWLINDVSVNSPDFTGPGSGRTAAGATTLSFPGTSAGNTYAIVNASTTVVPEPATAGLLVSLGGLIMFRRRCRTTTTTW
jgi:hypothetical protein